jgi:hypothetical protein
MKNKKEKAFEKREDQALSLKSFKKKTSLFLVSLQFGELTVEGFCQPFLRFFGD